MNHIESLERRCLFTAGGLDTYFALGGTAATDFGKGSAAITDIAVMSDGRIVAGGWRSLPGVTPTRDFALARYTVDGEADTTFSGDGKSIVDLGGNEDIDAIALDSDGSIVAAGVQGNGAIVTTRVRADGSLDESFAQNGALFAFLQTQGVSLARLFILSDGRILLIGSDIFGNALIGRYLADGRPDKSLSTGGFVSTPITRGPASFEISSAAVDENGKIVLCGTVEERVSFEQETFDSFGFVARLNADGTRDSSFGGDGVVATRVEPANEEAVDLFINSDGVINVLVRANSAMNVAQFSFNGEKIGDIGNSLDPTGLDSFRFTRQSDEKLLITDGINTLARMNADFTLDETFGGTTELRKGLTTVPIVIRDVALGLDGGILVAGTSSDQFAIQRLWRSAAPAATFEGHNRTRAGTTAYHFQITYRDDDGLDITSIDNSDIEIVDPHGAHIRAYLESKGVTPGGQLLATYKVKPPGGRWDQSDNGRSTVRVISNRVQDKAGNFMQGRALGSFRVGIT